MDKLLRVARRIAHKFLFFYLYIGKNTTIYGVPKYINARNVIFGNNVRINDEVFFHASEKIIIGNNTTFSYGCSLFTETYIIDDIDKYNSKEHKAKRITIGNNTWIGAKAIILPGVNIGNNIIVGAGSVVTHDLNEEYTIYAGNPARKIRKFGNIK